MPPGQPGVEVDALRTTLDARRPFTPELVERLQRWLVPHYIWSSEAIGAKDALSIAETTAFIEREACSGGHPLERFLALSRHKKALALAEQRAREGGVVDVSLLRDLHRTLFDGARGVERPGEWKQHESPEARRRGRAFRFAGPDAVPDLIERLTAGFREKLAAAEHPLRAVAWLYYHLHTIHPFEQGNGSVCRLVATTALLHHGYPQLILDARDPGPYLDALAACDATVPPGEAELLSPRVDITPLLSHLSGALERTARRVLAIVERRELAAGDLAETVQDGQERLLEAMLAQKDLSWRVRGSFEVRALHSRLARFAEAIACKGPLYSIAVENTEVVRTHAAWREFQASFPAGEAGVVGQLEVAIRGEGSTNLRFSEAPRLRAAVVCSQVGATLIFQWEDETKPKAHPGPPRSEEWPDAALDKLVTRAIDARRRAFEMRLVDDNLSAQSQARIKALLDEQPGRDTLKLRRVTQAFSQAPYRSNSGRLVPIAPLTEPTPGPQSGVHARPTGAFPRPGTPAATSRFDRVTPEATPRPPRLDTPPATRRPLVSADDPSLDRPSLEGRGSPKATTSPRPPVGRPPAEESGPGPRPTKRLEGLSPAEPPLSF